MKTGILNRSMKLMIAAMSVAVLSVAAQASELSQNETLPNVMDELNPADPNIDQIMKEMDEEYERQTGQSPHLKGFSDLVPNFYGGCYRLSCEVYLRVIKSEQKAYLYVGGRPSGEFLVSTGASGYATPDFDRHPNGRIYDSYSSRAYPGGDYNGLGNMPYAVFIQGGYAVHGTAKSNWQYLGQRASHGCVRMHPDNARKFNRLVRANGISNVWITIE